MLVRRVVRSVFPAAVIALLMNCGGGDKSVAPATPKTLNKQAGDGQSGVVGTAVATAPSVIVLDASNAPMAGVTVAFVVTSGGGSLAAATATTAASGVASVGSWTLGTTAGGQTLTATIAASGVTGNPATFTATATAGSAKMLTKQGGDNITSAAGVAVATPPSVKVVDQYGNAVSGVSITFAVASGGGSVTGATVATDASGLATVGGWTLGTSPSANTLTATTSASGVTGSPATFTATANAGAPKTVTKQSGDNTSAVTGAAVTVAPSVKVVDQFNNPVSGVTVTFAIATGGGVVNGATQTTSAAGVAAVGSWTLGGSPGANTLTATVTGTGITGNPATFTATATAPAFNPTGSATLGGTVSYASVNIPAGVTVTVTSDLILSTSGAVTIAGTLTGDCRAMNVSSTGPMVVSGTITNACTTLPDSAPSLTLVGAGGYQFTSGSAVRSHGEVVITNNLALVSALGAMPAGITAPTVRRVSSLVRSLIDYDCTAILSTFEAPAARNGTNGTPDGTRGSDGRKWTLGCQGNGFINGTTVSGADGGNGGNGTHTSNTAAVSKGGPGGKGGELRVRVAGQLDFGAGFTTLNSGAGGNGGTANATSTANPALPVAPPATATGGDGGVPGLISVSADGGISIVGSLTLNIGRGGNGGAGTAVAADGADATAARDAQIGGKATATGGAGGSAPNKQLQSNGNVAGAPAVAGGNGGMGGVANATSGKGGDGVVRERPDGAIGGAIVATGGRGGNSDLRNLAGALIGNGGNGNDVFMRRAFGGNGYNDCVAPLIPGGKGGAGGGTSGGRGPGGTGAANGTPGTTRAVVVANGGNGGNGLGPGAGGAPGVNTAVGAPVITAPSYQPGANGKGCRFAVTLTVANDPSPPHEGFVLYTTVGILDVLVDNIANTITITGIAGGKWIAVNGPYNPVSGAFTATGSGTAAGIANVPSSFTGSINLTTGQITGSVTLSGTSMTPPGGLPGHSVTYNVSGSVTGATP